MAKKDSYENVVKQVRKQLMDLADKLDLVILLSKEGQFTRSESRDLLRWVQDILSTDIYRIDEFLNK